jgi:hypothetical protein
MTHARTCLLLFAVLPIIPAHTAEENPAKKAAEKAPIFKAGFAERDITPDIGMEAPGGYKKAFYKSIHDPSKVRAAVFDDGSTIVAIVGLDALSIHRTTVEKVRRGISKKTGLPENAILLTASHSHSSGPMAGTMPGEFDDAPEEIKKFAVEFSTAVDPKFLAKFEKAIIDAVVAAYEGRVVCKAGIGRGTEKTATFNRRFKMRQGYTMTHPGHNNPDILEPAGPIDPEVGVIGAFNDKGELLGCVVNFACHATTNPVANASSANYIYFLEKAIRGYYGEKVIVVFTPGAGGDVTQVDNRNPVRQPSAMKYAQVVGGKVGAEAVKTLIAMEPGVLVPLAYETKMLGVKRRAPSAERVKEAREIAKKIPKPGEDDTNWLFAKETILAQYLAKKEPTVQAEIMAMQVGPAVFLTTPSEYFCKYGLEQKAKSGFPFTFPVMLANGCVGYVPTKEAFDEDGGGYETRLTGYSNLDINAGNLFRDAGIELAKKIKPGLVPTAGKAMPFSGKPWTYGSVRPQAK